MLRFGLTGNVPARDGGELRNHVLPFHLSEFPDSSGYCLTLRCMKETKCRPNDVS